MGAKKYLFCFCLFVIRSSIKITGGFCLSHVFFSFQLHACQSFFSEMGTIKNWNSYTTLQLSSKYLLVGFFFVCLDHKTYYCFPELTFGNLKIGVCATVDSWEWHLYSNLCLYYENQRLTESPLKCFVPLPYVLHTSKYNVAMLISNGTGSQYKIFG